MLVLREPWMLAPSERAVLAAVEACESQHAQTVGEKHLKHSEGVVFVNRWGSKLGQCLQKRANFRHIPTEPAGP